MKILLTNDDGIGSPGLDALKKALKDHELWIVAPETERSGTSHAITIKDPVRFTALTEREYSCSGTPADCIMFSFLGAVAVKPDLVISGINIGPNLGTDILYSGTAAAARQAALMGTPACAVSLNTFKAPFYFYNAADFIRRNLDILLSLWAEDHFININVPNKAGSFDVEITNPSRRIYQNQAPEQFALNGQKYYFLQSSFFGAQSEEGSDWDAVNRNKISVSPIYVHPINHSIGDRYHTASFR